MIFKIFKARLHYHEYNTLLGVFEAETLADCKEAVKKPISEDGLFKNPFYVVITNGETGEVLHNHHLKMQFDNRKPQTKYMDED